MFRETHHSFCILVIHTLLFSLNTSELPFYHSRTNTFFSFSGSLSSSDPRDAAVQVQGFQPLPGPEIPVASRSRGRFQVQVQRWIALHVRPLRALSLHQLYEVFFFLIYMFIYKHIYIFFK